MMKMNGECNCESCVGEEKAGDIEFPEATGNWGEVTHAMAFPNNKRNKTKDFLLKLGTKLGLVIPYKSIDIGRGYSIIVGWKWRWGKKLHIWYMFWEM